MSDHFLLFMLAGRRLAVPVARVEGVLPPGRVTPVPFVPDWVDGLVVARGVVHAQIDLLAWLTGERHVSASYELLQMTTPEGPALVKVDRVLRLVRGMAAPAPSPQLLGLLDLEGEEVAVIDPLRISFGDIDGDLSAAPPSDLIEARRFATEVEVTAELTVVVAALGENFALPIRRVEEVVEITAIEPLPLAPPVLIGLITLRNRVLPLISLAVLLGGAATDVGTRAVLVTIGGRSVALLVDRVVGLERAGELEEHPLLDQWQGLIGCWMGEKGGVIGLIHLDSLMDEARLAELAAFLPSHSGRAAEQPPEPRRLLLTFSVAGHACAIDAVAVERVLEWQQPGAVPEGGKGIDGVVQVMSDVVPVVNVGRHLGLAQEETRAFLVARLGADLAALAIGQPGRITAVPLSAFHPLGDDQSSLVDAVAQIDGELTWVLSLATLDRRVAA